MAAKLIISTGKLTFLRAHEVDSGFGPANDSIDGEAVVKLSSHPDRAMGFPLRVDADRVAHEAMFHLLRDAFAGDLTVTIEYSIDLDAGKKNGMILRVALQR